MAGGDVAALAEVIHPNIVDHHSPPGAPPGREGMAFSMQMLQGGFWPRRSVLHQVIAEGDTVVLHGSFCGRHTGVFMGLAPTSRSVTFRQVHLLRFQDGLAIEHWAVPDELDLARQLAAIPGPPAASPCWPMPGPAAAELHPQPAARRRAGTARAALTSKAVGAGGTDGRGPHSASVHRPCGPMGQPPGRGPGRPRHRRPAARGGRGRLGYSETVFVDDLNHAQVRIFSPTSELGSPAIPW